MENRSMNFCLDFGTCRNPIAGVSSQHGTCAATQVAEPELAQNERPDAGQQSQHHHPNDLHKHLAKLERSVVLIGE